MGGVSRARRTPAEESDEDEFPEGKVVYRMHRAHERNPAPVKLAKQRALSGEGRLACAVSSFDFSRSYGTLGEGYIECHHTLPLSALARERRTRVEEVALLCSNSHRMVHRARPCGLLPNFPPIISRVRSYFSPPGAVVFPVL